MNATLSKRKSNELVQNNKTNTQASQSVFSDNRKSVIQQKKLQNLQKNSNSSIQLKPKKDANGLPADLKQGMEATTGVSLDHVKVHYNSPKPAQLQAHAYAQGSDIHLASGQEQHLPHELGHVVQQAKGQVSPTTIVDGQTINDSPALESQADSLGEEAMQLKSKDNKPTIKTKSNGVKQLQTGALGLSQGSLEEEEETTAGKIEGYIEKAQTATDVSSKGAGLGSEDASTGIEAGGSILGFIGGFAKYKQADGKLEKMEAVFSQVSDASAGASGIASLIGKAGGKGGEETGAIGGVFSSGCATIATGFSIIQKLVKEDKISKGEAANLGIDSLSAIKDVVSSIADLMDVFTKAPAGLVAANPALQIAISTCKIIMDTFYLYESYNQKNLMTKRQEELLEKAGAKSAVYDKASEAYRKRDARIANKKYVIRMDEKRLAEIDENSEEGIRLTERIETLTQDCDDIANETVSSIPFEQIEEYSVAKELRYINQKRIIRQSIHVTTSIAKIAGSIATLTGAGALVGAGLSGAASATEGGMVAIRTGKQKARDRRARKEAKGKSAGLLLKRFDASKSSMAKKAERLNKVKFIIKKAVTLSLERPKDESAVAGLENYVKATGVNTGRLYSKNGQADEQIKLMFEAMSQREM